jgi:hypothetical protein
VGIRGAVYREVHAASRTTVDLGVKAGADKVLAKNFAEVARKHLAK